MAAAASIHPEIRYAPLARLSRSPFATDGTYRIPLPYAARLDVRRAQEELGVRFTALEDWIPQVGAWMDEFYAGGPVPAWYGKRALERAATAV